MTPRQLLTSKRQDWQTPLALYERLHSAFSFMLDPCTSVDNPLGTPFFFTQEIDGLAKQWQHDAFVNPPYNDTKRWIQYAYKQSTLNGTTNVCLIASRTGTKVWQKTIFPHAKAICFIDGRLKFDDLEGPATFDSALVVFSPSDLTYGQVKSLQFEGQTIILKA